MEALRSLLELALAKSIVDIVQDSSTQPELSTGKRRAAERDAPDPLVPSRVLRQARQRAEQLQEELDDVRVALFASTEALDAARSEAKAELRPVLKQEAAQNVQNVLTQA